MNLTKQTSALLTICLAGFLTASCANLHRSGSSAGHESGSEAAIFTLRSKLAEFDYSSYGSDKNKVLHGIISLESDQHGKTFLSAKLIPLNDFRLYAKNLLSDTNETHHTQVFGTPTVFKLLPNSSITQDGPIFEDVPAYETFEYYGDDVAGVSSLYRGAVTFRMPVILQVKNTAIEAQVTIIGTPSNSSVSALMKKTVQIKIPAKW